MRMAGEPAEELPDKILDWLRGEGYPLEMRVASVFRSLGFRVDQGTYYQDPQSSDLREIDLVVSIQDDRTTGILMRVNYVIECKSSRTAPWVLFTSEDHGLAPPASVVQRIGSKLGRALHQLCARKMRFS